jgi:hypothetical protein
MCLRLVNQKYEWEPKIWDPQAASETIHPVFKSPAGTLPFWLKWEEGGTKLVGIPTEPTGPIIITALAEVGDSLRTLLIGSSTISPEPNVRLKRASTFRLSCRI